MHVANMRPSRSYRILIICTHFPPTNATGARRPYYLARTLAERGHQVTVLTSEITGSDRWSAELQGLRVVRRPRTTVQSDLAHWQRWLARLHRKGVGRAWHGPLRVLADLLLPLEHATRWDLGPEGADTLLGIHDIVIATGPGWSTAQFGAALAKSWKALFNIDYRDPWTVSDPAVAMDIVTDQGRGAAGALRTWRMRRAERRIAGAADLLTATSGAFVRNASAIANVPHRMVVYGGFDPDMRPTERAPTDRFTVTYTGRLYPEQDWERLFGAIDRISQLHPSLLDRLLLRFVGPVSTDTRLMERLQDQARQHPCYELQARCSREEALAAQQDSDALLHATYRDRKGYLPVKFLEYLGAGRPLILVSAEHDEAEEILHRTRVGVVVPDAPALVELLMERIQRHLAGEAWHVAPNRQELERFAYPRRMTHWAEALESLATARA